MKVSILLSLALAVSIGAAGARAPHPNSISSSRIEVSGARIRHELLLDPLAIFEVLPAADGDGDVRLDAAELAHARGPIGEYVARH